MHLPPKQSKGAITIDDPRFLALRKKLDALSYHQTLHPDSYQLAQALVLGITKLHDKNDKLKRQSQVSQVTKFSNSKDLEDKIQSLTHQLDMINQTNYQLKSQNQKWKQKLCEMQSNQKFKKMESHLQSCVLKYEKQISKLTQKVRELQMINQQFRYKNQSSGEQREKTKSILEGKLQEVNQYNSQLASLVQKKNNQIKFQVEEKSKLKLKISGLERMIEDIQQQKQEIRAMNSNKSSKMSEVLKGQIQQLQRKNELLKIQLSESKSENDKLKMAIKNVNDELISLKRIEQKNKQAQSLNYQVKSELQRMFEETKDKLAERIQAISKLEAQKFQSQKLVNMQNQQIKELKNKERMLTDRVNQLQGQISSLGIKMTQKIKENKELQNMRISYENRIKQYQNQRIKEQQVYAPNRIKEIDQQVIRKEFEKTEKTYQRQLKLRDEQIEVLKKNQRDIIIERDRLKGQMQRQGSMIMKGNDQIEQMQNQRERLMKQNNQVQKMLRETQNIDYDSKSQIIRLRQNLSSCELIITDLKTQLKGVKAGSSTFNIQIDNLEQQLNRQQEKARQVFEDNRQLKLSNESLSRTNKELLQKYKEVQHQHSQKQTFKNESTKQLYKLKDQIEALRAQVQQKEMSLLTIDNERDQLQNVLDQKTEQNQRLKHFVQKLQREVQNYGQGLTQTDINYQGLYKKYSELQTAYNRMLFQADNLRSQVDNLRTLSNKKDITIGQLQNQLNLTVIGSKNQGRDVDSLRNQLIILDKKLKQKIKDFDQMREKNGELKIQLKQIYENYEKERNQNSKLSKWVEQLELANNDIYERITHKDNQIEQMNHALLAYQRREGMLTVQINEYQKQINSLSEKIQRYDDQLHRTLEERDVYRIEASSWKKQSGFDWRAMLQEKNSYLQKENAIKKNEMEMLRKKVKEFQLALKEERQRNYFLQSGVQGTARTANQRTPIRLIDSRASIDQYNENQNWNNYNTDPQNNMPPSPSNASSETFLFDTTMNKSQTHSQIIEANTISPRSNGVNFKKNEGIANINSSQLSKFSRQSLQSDRASESSVKVMQKVKNATENYLRIMERENKLKKEMNKV